MQQVIAQWWNRVLNLIFQRIIWVLTIGFCLAVGIALSSMSSLSSRLIVAQALQNATLSAKVMNEARILYNDEAVNRANVIEGITVTHDYRTTVGAIPNPATYTIELGARISDELEGSFIRLYSDYPFPDRQAEGGPRDQFERDALEYLRENPTALFSRKDTTLGYAAFRYAEAIVMEPSCVACHNSHPESPKKDWNVGDVRGIIEIAQPVDRLMAKTQSGLRSLFIMLGGLSVLGLSGLALTIGKLRRIARELERRVRERTADLAQANQDLEAKNQLIGQIFGRYLSAEVVTNLLQKPEELKLGGDRKTLTILTSDLRGFTALSERLSSEEVVRILNLYLKYMSETIAQYQGTINKFMGDGILVFFGVPTQRDDDAQRAVACAVAMQLAMASVNETMHEWGHPPLEMGIGINTGDAVVGNIGSETRMDYSAIGNQVNLTYRIESYTVGGQILISESTFQQVRDIVQIDSHKQIHPKGVRQPLTIYQVGGVRGEYNLVLPKEEETFFPLSMPISLQYIILEGKHLGANTFDGSLVGLSLKGGQVKTNLKRKDDLPPEMSNIKLKLWKDDPTFSSEEVYAKVTSVQLEEKCFEIRFTSYSPGVEAKLKEIYQSIP